MLDRCAVRFWVLASCIPAILACSRNEPPRLLHDVPSPDGRFSMRVVVHQRPSNFPFVEILLATKEGEGLRSDGFKVKVKPDEIHKTDFRVTWTSETRVEVAGWKTRHCASVWQLEDGVWMDRRSWEDREVR